MDEEVKAKMKAAAKEAAVELDTMPKEAEAIGLWIKRHFLKAGYKNLAKELKSRVDAETKDELEKMLAK